MKKNQGFTLIELMIVIAIIAILMAYAIPAYRDYTVRAKAGEAIALAAGAKLSVSEYFIDRGVWPANNAEAGLDAPGNITGTNVASVTNTAGVIEVVFNNTDATLNGTNLSLSGVAVANGGSVNWVCKNSTGTLQNKYVPTDCRN